MRHIQKYIPQSIQIVITACLTAILVVLVTRPTSTSVPVEASESTMPTTSTTNIADFNTATILEYHRIGEPPRACELKTDETLRTECEQIAVQTDEFQKQMSYLVNNGYTFYFTYELVEMWKNNVDIPDKAVAVTFDDAERVVYTNAWPTIKALGIKINLYPIVEETNRGETYRMTWDQIKEMQQSGLVNVGSHTMTHTKLSLDDDPNNVITEAEYELQESKRQLESQLGITVRSFSYPRGGENETLFKMVEAAGYTDAITVQQNKADRLSNSYALPRISIERHFTVDDFIAVVD